MKAMQAMKSGVVAVVAVGFFTFPSLADATVNVTNLIGRLDPLTANVLSNFVMLTNIPRPTYHEKKVSDALVAWAKEREFSPYQDEKNNVWFRISATLGMETKPKVILQCHMDMVAAGFDDPENECVVLDCDETGKIFSKDHKTSIGADDGLGVAMALAVADGKVPHGPVCVLVTTDEEQTETGAMAVPPELFEGTPYLINLDSESDGKLTISSAACDVICVTGTVATVSAAKPSAYCVKIENFRGGHSGQDIAKERLNAILELGRVLTNAVAEGVELELAEMTGGNAKNAIPPHAQAIVAIDETSKGTLEGLLSAAQTALRNRGEANATVSLVATNGVAIVLDETARNNVLTYLTTVHDGVWNMSSEIPGLVETSMNHGLVAVTKDGVSISGTARGSVGSTVQAEETSISNTAKTCGFDFEVNRACAPWPADISNPLIGVFSNAWKKVTGGEMTVTATHAGLECGWFSQKAPAIKIVSVGPTIQNPHTVNETTYANSVSNNIQMLSEALATVEIHLVHVATNAALDVAGMTWKLVDSDGNPLTEIDSEGRFVVQSNAVVNVLYTAEKGTYFKDGSTTFRAGFRATGAQVFDVSEMIAERRPTASDVAEPMLQLGVVAQRYPWNGILDVQYKATYVPMDVFKLKLRVEINGVAKEFTTRDCIKSGVSTVDYDVKSNFGEVKTKGCKVTAKLVTE